MGKKWLKNKNAIEVHNVLAGPREPSGVVFDMWRVREHQMLLWPLCFYGSLNYPLHAIFIIMFASLERHSRRLWITMFVVSNEFAMETQPKTFNFGDVLRPSHSIDLSIYGFYLRVYLKSQVYNANPPRTQKNSKSWKKN